MSERSTVRNPMMKYAQSIGWDYLPPDEALRQRAGDTGLFLLPVPEKQYFRFGPGGELH